MQGVLDGAAAVSRWAQVADVQVVRTVTGGRCWAGLLPRLRDGHVRGAAARLHAGSVSTGRCWCAAVVLTAYGNVRGAGRAGHGHAAGVRVSPGWVEQGQRLGWQQLGKSTGLDEAMLAALARGEALTADETPVNVLDSSARNPPGGKKRTNRTRRGRRSQRAHVLIVPDPGWWLTWLQAIGC